MTQDELSDFLQDAQEHLNAVPDAAQFKVLVVDDEQDVANLAGALLAAHGFAVTVVYSPFDALQALAHDSGTHAVFSDIAMPGMTGLQLAGVIQKLYPHIRVTLASGYAPPDLLSERGTLYHYTPKPYDITTVIELLCTELAPLP